MSCCVLPNSASQPPRNRRCSELMPWRHQSLMSRTPVPERSHWSARSSSCLPSSTRTAFPHSRPPPDKSRECSVTAVLAASAKRALQGKERHYRGLGLPVLKHFEVCAETI